MYGSSSLGMVLSASTALFCARAVVRHIDRLMIVVINAFILFRLKYVCYLLSVLAFAVRVFILYILRAGRSSLRTSLRLYV